MLDKMVYVSISLAGESRLVGRLWHRIRKGRESTSFQYDNDWLANPNRFSLEPLLNLQTGVMHTNAGRCMFGAIGDSAPDRWGRVLMRKMEFQHAKEAQRTSRTLSELDYVLLVNDEARQGALRFSLTPEGPYLASHDHIPIPPLIELPRLLSATERYLEKQENTDDLTLLLAPGSSLGGARPKASIREHNGALSIAKFPRKDDEYATVEWEAVALFLAHRAKIEVPQWRIEKIANKSILILQRFDREGEIRKPFLSAMSMLSAQDNELHSYLELIDAIKQYGAAPQADMIALWRRIVFSVLISNTDDHLRNHGFLYELQKGWRLSPAYDLNPTPISIKPRYLTTAIDMENTTASLTLALSVSSKFGLTENTARKIIKEVGEAVNTWRQVASSVGIKSPEINRMASAFEHDDLTFALRA